MRVAALVILCLVAAGCGGAQRARTTAAAETERARSASSELRVAAVGNVALPDNVTPVGVDDAELVFVDAGERPPADPPAAAHVVLVGRSHEADPGPRVSGLLFEDREAAYLAGVVAGLVVSEEGVTRGRIAWVGTERAPLVDAYVAGARSLPRKPTILRSYVAPEATRCKEAALDVIARGASVVFSGSGACSLGARAAAREQNALGLSLADFEAPRVAVAQTIADARRGLFHEDEDVVFGAASGAVGVGDLGARVSPETIVEARRAAQELAAGVRTP